MIMKYQESSVLRAHHSYLVSFSACWPAFLPLGHWSGPIMALSIIQKGVNCHDGWQLACHTIRQVTSMMTSWHGNAFRIIGPLWGESSGDRCIPLIKWPVMRLDVPVDASLNMLLNNWTNSRVVDDRGPNVFHVTSLVLFPAWTTVDIIGRHLKIFTLNMLNAGNTDNPFKFRLESKCREILRLSITLCLINDPFKVLHRAR